MILEILFVVDMFLWFLTCLPVPKRARCGWGNSWLGFMAVLLLSFSDARPPPVSETQNTTSCSLNDAPAVIEPPASVNLMALPIRFSSA